MGVNTNCVIKTAKYYFLEIRRLYEYQKYGDYSFTSYY